MKFALILALLGAGSSFASGVKCTSTCLVYDMNAAQVYLLGSVTNSADLITDDLYRILQEQCRSRAKKSGLPEAFANLVRSIDFVQSTTKRDYTVIHSAYRCNWLVEQRESTSVIYREVMAKIDFDDADRACKVDQAIPNGTTPIYPGDLPFQD